MQFLDQAKIYVKGGNGGNGCVAFRREKFVPRGGPSGGDGGRGGNVYLEASSQHNTLLHFRFNPEHKAARGEHGRGDNCHGRDGEDLIVPVPVGTTVTDSLTGELVCDLEHPLQRILIAPGGRGGRGNARFATSTKQAPRYHEEGQPGVERWLQFELKLIADVGLVGYPNVGKSTLISRVSDARPKIADYPFTTLEPNLGVVAIGDYQTLVFADIPGLIEGASEGHGLGLDFLRHVERTRLLLHLVDVTEHSGRDPVRELETINRELASYSAELAAKPQIIVASRIDALQHPARLDRLREYCEEHALDFAAISAVTGEGLKELLDVTVRRWREIIAQEERERSGEWTEAATAVEG